MSRQDLHFLHNLKYDVPASIVVFLVAVPLCLGIALASGAPLFGGIIAGMVGGIIVTIFSDSQLGVSGPAAGLVVIVVGTINEIGTYEGFLLAVIIAGVLQIILGYAKAGIIGYYFPSSVIKGMLTGIGLIIILKQIPHSMGYDGDFEGDFSFFQPDGQNTFSELINMMDYISYGALAVTIVSLFILILYEQSFMKRFTFSRLIPGPLVVVVAGILMNMAFEGSALFNIDREHLVSLPVAASFSDFFVQFTLPDFNFITHSEVYVAGFTIAIVASIETLLSVEAVDKLDPYKRITPTSRELKAQGIGNIVSGLIGGLPVTQVIVRSSANVQSGGRTKAASFIHGVFLLISAILIPTFLNLIPLASLAAILFLVGYKLAKPVLFKEMYKSGHSQFLPFIVTILGILFTDLLLGVAMGMAVGIFYILWNNLKTPYHVTMEHKTPDQPYYLYLSEDVSFLNKAALMRTFNNVPDGCKLIVDASRTKHMHPDIMELIEDFRFNADARGISFELKGIDESPDWDSEHRFHHLVLHGVAPKKSK